MLRAFKEEYGNVIVKAIATGYVVYGRRNMKVYSTRVPEHYADLARGLRFGPLIVQREVSKVQEVRVTVVDDHCFSVAFHCADLLEKEADIRKLDYRQHRDRFVRAVSTGKIESWSRQITRELGLCYAGIDWVVDRDGNWFFLECNPLGSFKWSEICGDFDISGTIARSLMTRAAEAVTQRQC
jgi:glutathione synthase/RimK-type ligase-like ATP-grasp enzyme